MHATIPANYTNLHGERVGIGFPVVIRVRDEDYTDPAAITYQLSRSFLRAAAAGSLDEWQVEAPRADGWDSVYVWDGTEVVRKSIRQRRPWQEIGATLESLNRTADTVNESEPVHPWDVVEVETPEPAKVETRIAADGRKVPTRYNVKGTGDPDERRKYARKVLAKAMGFSGVKDWKAAGFPLDMDKVRETVKAHKVDSMIADAALAQSPDATGGIQVHSMSVVRPTRLPGQYQGNSHNN